MKTDLKKILSVPSVEAAPMLLGMSLCRKTKQGVIKARIVETEAYHQMDPASHSYRGMTARTAPMFEAGGTIYVYFTYGMHYCMNIVVGEKGAGEAVLLRALEPLEGIEIMRQNRGVEDIRNLASGPGKLTQSFGITDTRLSGEKLNRSSIWLEMPEKKLKEHEIAVSQRIGIKEATNQPWRFYIKDNRFISRK